MNEPTIQAPSEAVPSALVAPQPSPRNPDEDPFLSVVVLTRNERANIDDCLRSLLEQTYPRFEVLVVDAASTDGTPDAVRAVAASSPPERVQLVASPQVLTVGAARNLGARLARGEIVAYVSADATVDPGWLEQVAEGLRQADVAFGRQIHAPPDRTPVAVVRGLRYHHFERDPPLEPLAYVSNVNAAFRRAVLERNPFPEDTAGSAIDDVLVARRAASAGHRVVYLPSAVVRHKDVTTLRGEIRKNRREGEALGTYRREVGPQRAVEGWGLALVATTALAFAVPTTLTVALILGVLLAPTARRFLRSRLARARFDGALVGAFLMTPLFDLVFLSSYLKGMVNPHDA